MKEPYAIYSDNLENWETFATRQEAEQRLSELSEGKVVGVWHLHERVGEHDRCIKIINQ